MVVVVVVVVVAVVVVVGVNLSLLQGCQKAKFAVYRSGAIVLQARKAKRIRS